jgi:hypothetical protein
MIEIRLSESAYNEIHDRLVEKKLTTLANHGFIEVGGIRFVDDKYDERWGANQRAFASAEAAYLEAPE